ncbi:MAG: penicillin acylase family protein [bacterium]
MWLFKKFAAVIITFFFISVSLIFFFYYLHSLSVPDDMQEIENNELNDVVKVYKHTAGIKHLVANNEADAYYMIGYIQASDRIFQMDILRRTAKGELSEILGMEYLPFDKYMRTLKIKSIADSNKLIVHKHVYYLLKKYSDGVNYFIKQNKNKLHFGFSALNYLPKLWTVEDCMAIQRLFAYQMSIAFKADINFGSIAEIIGVENTMRLLPDFEKNSMFIYDDYSSDSMQTLSSLYHSTYMNSNGKYSLKNQLMRNFGKQIEQLTQKNNSVISDIFNYRSYGCNVWAMRKIHDTLAEAILANDFHSGISIPSMWYQMQFSYPGTNIAGYALPGIPFVLSGRNDNIAWGIANAMIDDCDYFIEKADEKHDSYKIPANVHEKFLYKKDTIKITKHEDYIYYLRSTRRSPVISDFYSTNDIDYPSKLHTAKKPKIFHKYVLSYKWTGSFQSDEMTPLYLLSQVKNWNEFKYSFKTWKSPSLNFVYADKSGNIGLVTAGAIPKRGTANNMVLPNPGWLGEYDWTGLDTFAVIASIYNPQKRYVSASNGPLFRKTNYSRYFDLSSRARRIEELIQQYQKTDNYSYGTIDAQRMQTDMLSDFSREIFRVTQPVINTNLNTLKENEIRANRIINNWDFLYSSESPAPTIFGMFTMKLIENIFKSQLGNEAYTYYLDMPQFALNRTLELLKTYYPPNEDNTPSIEEQTKIYTIMISFKQAVDTLSKIYGTPDIKKWKYGNLHILKFRFPLNVNKFLEPVFKINDMRRSGDNTTINYSSWNYFEPYKIVSSVSFRFIADLSESNVSYSFPGGVSEDPINPNYTSQLHLWENGAYLKIPFSPKSLNETQLILTVY